MRLKRCVLSFLRKLVRDEISFMSDGSAFQARGRRRKRLCQLHEAEYVRRRSCRAHWTEGGCHHSAGRVLINIVEQYHGKR